MSCARDLGLGPGSRKPGLPVVRRQKKPPMSDPGSLFAKVGRLGGFDGQTGVCLCSLFLFFPYSLEVHEKDLWVFSIALGSGSRNADYPQIVTKDSHPWSIRVADLPRRVGWAGFDGNSPAGSPAPVSPFISQTSPSTETPLAISMAEAAGSLVDGEIARDVGCNFIPKEIDIETWKRQRKVTCTQVITTCCPINLLITSHGSRGAIIGLINHLRRLSSTATRLHTQLLNAEADQMENDRQAAIHLRYVQQIGEVRESARENLESRANEPPSENRQTCGSQEVMRAPHLQALDQLEIKQDPATLKQFTEKVQIHFFDLSRIGETSTADLIEGVCLRYDSTLMRSPFATFLNIQGTPQILEIDGAGGVVKHSSRRVQLQLRSESDEIVTLQSSTRNVVASPTPVTDWNRMKREWAHLRDLPTGEVGGRVDLSFGTEHIHLLGVKETREDKDYEPIVLGQGLGGSSEESPTSTQPLQQIARVLFPVAFP
ncbi:hypothetical protein OUZ56_003683 [Daphnia magna]|uniref:Uncharacterized protein n=1 Tax=Daphnia magna TaxID=35525 RepID=A0ABR0A9T4_9CRUS|nr:hypothetical protein OUZ56_003683 [Daphnia magna]